MGAIFGFPPVAGPGACKLILGSMPGQDSLNAQAYYANKHNVFWRLMGDLLGAGPHLDYADRLVILTRSGIALWDVIGSCEREGSLDANIADESVLVNNFAAFFNAYPGIHQIFFNGEKAEKSFRRHVLPKLQNKALALRRLPSTSPAHAALSYGEKLAAWQVIVEAPNNQAVGSV